MTSNPKIDFFDGIAEKWDGWQDSALQQKLAAGLDEFGMSADEHVFDVGCGTGNLTIAILKKLSSKGRVFAIDISQRMIDIARGKIDDARVSWLLEDVQRSSVADAACDRVICYSVWPHFDNRRMAALDLLRVLKPGGSLHIWHRVSREKMNAMHAAASEAVSRDILPPVEETADLLATVGFKIAAAHESDSRYLIIAIKPE